MAKLNMVEAINLALREEMERDNRVIVLGEDVGKEGGVFRVTDGLQEKFGADRVIDTPLAESGIVGTAFGMAVYGLRPIAEIQFEGFLYPCLDQINNHIGRIRNRSRGRFTCPWSSEFLMEVASMHPSIIRIALRPSWPIPRNQSRHSFDSLRSQGAPAFFHSGSRSCSSSWNPNASTGPSGKRFRKGTTPFPLGKARMVQEGKDVTIIAWGAMVREALNAAEQLKGDKIEAEIIDLRTHLTHGCRYHYHFHSENRKRGHCSRGAKDLRPGC